MPTKISKVAKELNVGVSTAAEFLRKHNIAVDDNPNARIDSDAVALLTKEFSKDKDDKAKSNSYSSPRRERRDTSRNERNNPEEIKTEVPRQGLRVLGKIDLDSPKGNVKKSQGSPH